MTVLLKPTKPNPGFKPTVRVHPGDENAQSVELPRFIRAALTGLLANRGFTVGFISKESQELNTLTHQAAMIGLQSFEKWLAFRAQRAQKAEAVKKFESKI
jgi:hypothetical protein